MSALTEREAEQYQRGLKDGRERRIELTMENKDCCEACVGKLVKEKGGPYCLNPDCAFCHSKAPEEEPLLSPQGELSMVGLRELFEAPKECDNNCLTFIKNGFCLHTGYPEAPTDEGWEKEFNDMTDAGLLLPVQIEIVKSFLSRTLQKEREKAKLAGIKIGNATGAGYKRGIIDGKSEAFSLVRHAIIQMAEETTPYHGKTLNEMLRQLSTLEGK